MDTINNKNLSSSEALITPKENDNSLSSLYVKVFKDIIKIVRDQQYQNVRNPKSGDVDFKKLKDYSNALTKCLKPLLFRIIRDLKNNGTFKIEKCLIKFNSLKTSTRVKIPFHGEDEKDYKECDEWFNSKENIEWRKVYFPSSDTNDTNDDAYMYRNPEKPIHILTELMWRFQEKQETQSDDQKDDFCLLIKRNSKDEKCKFDLLDKEQSQYRIKVLDLTEENAHEKQEINTKNKFEKLAERLNNLKPKSPKESRINMEKAYDDDDAERLLKGILDFLDREKKAYNPQSVFFIADLTEKESMAGFEFVLNCEGTPNLVKLRKFIQQIQWYFSKYIVELVSTVESLYATRGEDIVYRDNFFYRDPKTPENSAIKTIIKVLKEIIENDKIKEISKDKNKFDEIIHIILDHFKVADSGIGLYWTNYRHWSYQVARTVSKIIDELFYPDSGGKIEQIIQNCEIDLKGFNKKLKDEKIPLVFRQLFRGLEREKELFLISNYRDHFIHSFYVFMMGLIILSTFEEKIVPKKLKLNENNTKDILKKWFIVAMCHDIAYILEKGEDVLERFVLGFMEPKRKKKVLPWIPSLGNLMQIERLLDNIHVITDNVITPSHSFKKKLNARDIIVPVAFDTINHGIWSSLFVYHSLNNDKAIVDLFKNDQSADFEKNIILPICRAILPHHISDWKVDTIKEHFYNNYKDCLNDWKKTRINLDENALGYLLSLCDTLCQAGRDAPEMTEDSSEASDLGIKFDEISFDKIQSILNIFISYEEFKDGKNVKAMFEKYFTDPLRYLDLKASPKGDNFEKDDVRRNTLCIRIKNKKEGKEQEKGYSYYSL